MSLILLTLTLSLTVLFVKFVIFIPQVLTSIFHPPLWISVGLMFLLFSWCMGE